MADNTLYNNLMRAGYAATGGTGAAFENKPDGSVIIHPASDKAWYGSQKLADTAKAGATGRTTQPKPRTRAENEAQFQKYYGKPVASSVSDESLNRMVSDYETNFQNQRAGLPDSNKKSYAHRAADDTEFQNRYFHDLQSGLTANEIVQKNYNDPEYAQWIRDYGNQFGGEYIPTASDIWLQNINDPNMRPNPAATYVGNDIQTTQSAPSLAQRVDQLNADGAGGRQQDQQYMLWQALHPNLSLEDYYRIFPDRAPRR